LVLQINLINIDLISSVTAYITNVLLISTFERWHYLLSHFQFIVDYRICRLCVMIYCQNFGSNSLINKKCKSSWIRATKSTVYSFLSKFQMSSFVMLGCCQHTAYNKFLQSCIHNSERKIIACIIWLKASHHYHFLCTQRAYPSTVGQGCWFWGRQSANSVWSDDSWNWDIPLDGSWGIIFLELDVTLMVDILGDISEQFTLWCKVSNINY
jgi:hypothetical protein